MTSGMKGVRLRIVITSRSSLFSDSAPPSPPRLGLDVGDIAILGAMVVAWAERHGMHRRVRAADVGNPDDVDLRRPIP
jgi:hypothetical protein